MERPDFRSEPDTGTQTQPKTLIDEVLEETTVSEIMQSEIRAKMVEARAHPRKIKEFMDAAVALATLTPEIAASCRYVLERWSSKEKKKVFITGPSIRLAEICAGCWENLDWGARPISGAKDGAKQVVVEGWATDCQRNVTKHSTVTRKTTYKDGRPYNADMRIMAINAASAIASRNALFGIIPRSVVDEVMNKAVDVALGKGKGLKVRRDEVIAKLIKVSKDHGFDLTIPRILQSLGRASIQEINWDDVEVLIGKGVAITEDLSTVDEAFPTDVPTDTTQTDNVVTDILAWQNQTLGKVVWPGGKIRAELTTGSDVMAIREAIVKEADVRNPPAQKAEGPDAPTTDPTPTTPDNEADSKPEHNPPPANGMAEDVEKVMVFQRDGLGTTHWTRARVVKELQVEGATVARVIDALETEFDAQGETKATEAEAAAAEGTKDDLPMDDWKPTEIMAQAACHENKKKIANARLTQREAEVNFLESKSEQAWHDWIASEGKVRRAASKKGGK